MISLTSHFQRDVRRHSEWLRNQQWFQKAKEDRSRKDKAADGLEDDLDTLSAGLTLATKAEIDAFKVKLDHYDEATVKALMANQEKLDTVDADLRDILDRAYVMEDGRRAFKTSDGTKVIDEFGQEVSPDDFDSDAIPENKPLWEEYEPGFNERLRLQSERQELIDFQEKIDLAREKFGVGDISKSELEALDADLSEALPPAVKAVLTETYPTDHSPSLKSDFAARVREPTAAPANPHIAETLQP